MLLAPEPLLAKYQILPHTPYVTVPLMPKRGLGVILELMWRVGGKEEEKDCFCCVFSFKETWRICYGPQQLNLGFFHRVQKEIFPYICTHFPSVTYINIYAKAIATKGDIFSSQWMDMSTKLDHLGPDTAFYLYPNLSDFSERFWEKRNHSVLTSSGSDDLIQLTFLDQHNWIYKRAWKLPYWGAGGVCFQQRL